MSNSVLEKLKVKPKPKDIEIFKVKLNEPSEEENVTIKTKIVDKSKTANINRNDFLKGITTKVTTKTVTKKPKIIRI